MIWMVAVLVLQLTPVPFPTIASPTPVASNTPYTLPTLDTSGAGGLVNYLATAENALLTPINTPVGVPSEDGAQIFGYAKWLIDPETTEEFLGPFAPVANHLSVIFGIVLALAAAAIIIFIVVLIIRFVVWLITIVLKFVPFLG